MLTPSASQQAQALLLANRAWQLQQAGQYREAGALYQQALNLAPMHLEILWRYARLGNLAGDFKLALQMCERMLQLAAEHRSAILEGAYALAFQGRHAEAIAWFLRVEAHPETAQQPVAEQARLFNNIGACYKHLYDHASALPYYERAVALCPNEAEYVATCGTTLYHLGQDARAISLLRRAVKLGIKRPEVLAEMGTLLLRNHQWQEGWMRYRSRRDASGGKMTKRPYSFPYWDGSTPTGKLLLTQEQGMGDMILLATLLPDFLKRYPDTILEVHDRLVPLFRRAFPSIEVYSGESPNDVENLSHRRDIGAMLSLGDIGSWVRTREEDFNCQCAQILASNALLTGSLREKYRARFPGRKLVGISWQSKAEPQNFPLLRSIELSLWSPIFKVPGCAFINLQYGNCTQALAEVQETLGIEIYHDPDVDPLRDMDTFAAQVAALDHVITIDNTTAHVAGGLGIPTYLLTPATLGLSWFWGREGDTCPWYPSVRLYRGAAPGEWTTAIKQIQQALGQSEPHS